MEIGEAIKTLRKEQKLTIQELSRLSNVPRNEIGKIESGKGNPSYSRIKQIIEALGQKICLVKNISID